MAGKFLGFLLVVLIAYIAAIAIIIHLDQTENAVDLPPGIVAGESFARGKLLGCVLRFDGKTAEAEMLAIVEAAGMEHRFLVARGTDVKVAGFDEDPLLWVHAKTVAQYNGGTRTTYSLEGKACQ